jgi:hypothetical protein
MWKYGEKNQKWMKHVQNLDDFRVNGWKLGNYGLLIVLTQCMEQLQWPLMQLRRMSEFRDHPSVLVL